MSSQEQKAHPRDSQSGSSGAWRISDNLSLAPTETGSSSQEKDDKIMLEIFREEMERIERVKTEIAQEKSASNEFKRHQQQKTWRQQLHRMQCYLGLCTAPTRIAGSTGDVCPGLEHLKVTKGPFEHHSSSTTQYGTEFAPNGTKDVTRFVSLDVEAFEFNQRLVTEIGISTLETPDLRGVQPGAGGREWATKMYSRHFRIHEHRHRLNKRHVQGCPEDFQFGQSEWISERDVPSILVECFQTRPSVLKTNAKIVLVGHDLAGDRKYLLGLGFDVNQMISDCIDTSDIYKASRRDGKQRSLGSILLHHDIPARYLHNAGNDAAYTLRVMLAIALDVAQNNGIAEYWRVEKCRRIDAACELAKAKACADLEGWSTSEDEDNDRLLPEDSAVTRAHRVLRAAGRNGIICAGATVQRSSQNRRDRAVKSTHIDQIPRDKAVQDDRRSQEVSQSSYNAPLVAATGRDSNYGRGGNRDTRNQGRRRSRGRGRGDRRGRPSSGGGGRSDVA